MSTPHLVYLHGFLSSPGSSKGQAIAAWLEKKGLSGHFHSPVIPPTPQGSLAAIRAVMEPLQQEPVCLIGSSLGGFFATWAAEEYGCRAVLLNPAVFPYNLIGQYLGPQRNYHTGEIHQIEPGFVTALHECERQPTHKQRYWLLVQAGDEVLDYHQSVGFYAGCQQTILEGGDHSFVGFADWLPQIWDFACQGYDDGYAANRHSAAPS